jgi:hypothetical protein
MPPFNDQWHFPKNLLGLGSKIFEGLVSDAPQVLNEVRFLAAKSSLRSSLSRACARRGCICLPVAFEQTFAGCRRIMSRAIAKSGEGAVGIMSKPVPAKDRKPHAADNLDQAISGRHDPLRKPLKLTATLKRRALKNKVAGKNPRSEALSTDTDGEVESRTARLIPDLCQF